MSAATSARRSRSEGCATVPVPAVRFSAVSSLDSRNRDIACSDVSIEATTIAQAAAIVIYPVQRAAQMPGEALSYVATFFSSQRALADDKSGGRRALGKIAP